MFSHIAVRGELNLRGDQEFENATAMLFPCAIAQRGRMRDHTAARFRRRVIGIEKSSQTGTCRIIVPTSQSLSSPRVQFAATIDLLDLSGPLALRGSGLFLVPPVVDAA